jgi:phosphoribosylamine--glycine ligase
VAATVIVSSAGYPGDYEKGKAISGLEDGDDATVVFHCGTKRTENGVVTAGGRVLSVTGIGATLRDAVNAAYARIARLSFDGMFFRRDIAHRAFERES